MDTTPYNSVDFSLSEGGPFHNAMVKMRLHNKQGWLAIAGLCIAWVPLVIISAIEGTLYSGTQLPFLSDIAMQARVLVALQMLIQIKVVIDTRVMAVVKYIAEALMSADERKAVLPKILHRAKRLTNSAITEIMLLLIVVTVTISFANGSVLSALDGRTSSWMTSAIAGNKALSIAGHWAVFISIPIFQFLLLRWSWRYLVWMLLLFRLSKTDLNLLPTHADRAGGLGIVMLAQRSFNLVFVVGSVVLSGQFIARLIKNPDHFNTIRNEVVGYIVISIVFLLIPLLFFSGKLLKTKNNGLQHLGMLGATLSRQFEREWINDLSVEKRIKEKQVDPSLLFDYSGLYDQLLQLRTVPVTLRDIISLAMILSVPFIPILFIHFSVVELLQKIAGMLM